MRLLFVLVSLVLGILQIIADEKTTTFSREARPIKSDDNFNGSRYLSQIENGTSKRVFRGSSYKKNGTTKVVMDKDVHVTNGWRAQRGMIPWQASITMDQSNICGGSLITTRHVLSAAHCVDNTRNLLVVLGAQNFNFREQGRVVMQTRKKVAHPDYNSDLLKNDISIIYLPRKVTVNNFVDTVRLPYMNDDKLDYTGVVGVISGWGKTKDKNTEMSPTLMYADVVVMNDTECLNLYGDESFHDTTLCALGEYDRATCLGDSGGPLVMKDWDDMYTQIGVVSYGAAVGCGKGYPDVFTRVSSYVGWISVMTSKPRNNLRRVIPTIVPQ